MVKKTYILWFLIFLLLLFQFTIAIVNPYDFYAITFNASLIIFSSLVTAAVTVVIFHRSILIPQNSIPAPRWSPILDMLNLAAGLLYLIVCIINVYFMITRNLSMQEARNFFFFGTGQSSIFQQVGIFFTIAKALVTYHFFIWALRISARQKVNKMYVIVYFFYLMFAISTGSRTIFYELCIMGLFFLQFLNLRIFMKKKVLFAFLTIISLMVLMVVSRMDASGLLFFCYKYFVGPLHFFSKIIDNTEIPVNNFGYLFGGVHWFFTGLFNTLGFDVGSSLHVELNSILAFGTDLTSSVRFNAHPSGYFFFSRFSEKFSLLAYPVTIMILLLLKLFSKNSDDKTFIIFLIFWFSVDMMRSNIFWNFWSVSFIIILLMRGINDRFWNVKYA